MKLDLKNLKPKDPKRQKEKNYQPPGTNARKGGVIAFYALLILILFLLFALLGASRAPKATITETEANAATTPAATEFAKKFATEYFTWTAGTDGWEDRKNRLAPMLAKGLDEQAGLVTSEQSWNSNATKTEVLQVTETGKDHAIVVVQVEQVLSDNDESENQTHSLAVPVAYNQAFGVYDLPNFTAVQKENAVAQPKNAGKAVESEVEAGIKSFMPTFFQSYTTDTPDKLAYFLQDPQVKQGLEGSVKLESVQEVIARESGTAGEYDVKTNVLLVDEKTGSKYSATYRLKVKENDGRFVVNKLNLGVE